MSNLITLPKMPNQTGLFRLTHCTHTHFKNRSPSAGTCALNLPLHLSTHSSVSKGSVSHVHTRHIANITHSHVAHTSIVMDCMRGILLQLNNRGGGRRSASCAGPSHPCKVWSLSLYWILKAIETFLGFVKSASCVYYWPRQKHSHCADN